MKSYTINQWCEIFGIELIDIDGLFRGWNLDSGVTLEIFVKGITECTIFPKNVERYKVLEMLW